MIDESTTRQHELKCRVSALEDEVEGEKGVSRHILQETRQNSSDLAAIKAQLMHLAGDMVVANAALNNHGTRLNVLTQEVREIRTGMGEMRVELARTHTAMDEMRAELTQTHKAMGEMRPELAQTHTAMGDMRAEMDRRFDAVEHSMALILATVAPRAP